MAVAIDENATLKRFMKMGDFVLLIPKKKCEPIQVKGEQVSIIGVTVGVAKKVNYLIVYLTIGL